MDEQTKKDIYEIIEQGKILEALMKELELESALTEKQKNNLASEEFFIDSALCNAGCISDIIPRIDSADYIICFFDRLKEILFGVMLFKVMVIQDEH